MITTSKRNRCLRSNERGNVLAETPVVLAVFLLVIVFPLIDLGTLFFGASSVYSAASVAAVEAARAPSYRNDVVSNGETRLSAIHMAQQKATQLSTGNVSITPDDVEVEVLQTPLTGGEPTVIIPAAAFEPDTGSNMYQIRVTVTGRVSPLVTLSSKLFGQVPGLTAPLVVRTASTARYENVEGLSG